MRGGSRIAIEQMDVAMEEGLKMIARSRFFPLYSLCLFVPGALRPVAIWLAGAEIGSLFFYYAATPANLFQWTSALIFLTVSGLIWLVYGWSVMLGERANPTNIRVRTTLLFKVIRKGRSFEDVSPAESGEIDDVFDRKGREWVQVGSLLRNQKVRVSVNVDKVASRHLAILSVTGSGKSNLLALITKKISELRGTMIVFDYHGEYSELAIPNAVHVDAKINPRHVDADQLADLLDVRENAEVQRTVLSKAFTDEVKGDKEFWEALLTAIGAIEENEKQYKKAAARLADIVKMAMRRMKSVIDPDIGEVLDQLKASKINILNMIEFTEKQANAAISYYMDEVLDDRKRATRKSGDDQKVRFETPVVCAIEEAHAFIPAEGDTDTKYIASKVAREGRKFGMSLIVVSQRPRRACKAEP